MKVRKLPPQKAGAWLSAMALDRMTTRGMPMSGKIYWGTKMGLYGQKFNHSTKPLYVGLFGFAG
jgi:hypothetical protein